MNIGIIGAGRIAEKLAAAINNVDGVNLYAISSRSFEKARVFAEKYNVSTWYEGTDDFYNNSNIDLVYIATPNSFHKQQTMECLEHNKAVLCEKPFALNREDSLEMFELAKKQNLLLVEAMWTKYFPAVKKVKELLDSGCIGDIIHIQGDLSYPLGREKERLYKKEQGGGALLDLGVYPITMAHYFMGKPNQIEVLSHFTKEGVDETTSMVFKYNSGVNALLNCSISAHGTNEFLISGTKGWLRLNGAFHHAKSISCYIEGVGEQHQEFPWKTDGYEYQIEGLLEDYSKGLTESSTVKINDTLEIMGIMDEIRSKIGYEFD